MMGRLIDIDRLCNDLAKRWSIADKKKEDTIRAVMADVVTPIVVSQPTVDAVPVVHGRWITHHEKVALLNGEAFGGVYCSECGYKTHNKLHLILGCPFKYCPNCGARMDKE